MHLLDAALGDLQSSSLIPAGYGVRESEWDEGAYPEVKRRRYHLVFPQ
jgi:hypothetical protein